MKYSQKKEQNFLQSLHEPFKRAYDALFDSNLLNFPRFLLDGGPFSQQHSLIHVMQQDLMECSFDSVTEFESFIDTLLTTGVASNIKEMSKAKDRALIKGMKRIKRMCFEFASEIIEFNGTKELVLNLVTKNEFELLSKSACGIKTK